MRFLSNVNMYVCIFRSMSRLGMLIRVTTRAHTTYYTAGSRDPALDPVASV